MNRLAWLLVGMLSGAIVVVAAMDQGWITPAGLHRALRPYAWQLDAAPPAPAAPVAVPGAPAPASPAPASPAATAPAREWPESPHIAPMDPPPAEAVDGALPLPDATQLPVPPTPAGPGLLVPVRGVSPKQLSDTYTQSRGEGRLHDAIDIMAPRGTPVLAVADGRIAKLFDSKQGGLTVYQFDQDEKLAYYYAHLDAYAPGLTEGKMIRRGDVIGTVGSTGNANPEGPHLHFAVFVLGPEKRWWKGTPVNPYPLLGGG